MTTGWVQVGFFHIQTRPASLLSKLEHGPINKRVFYAGPRPAPPGPMGPTQPMPFQGPIRGPIKKKKKSPKPPQTDLVDQKPKK